MPTGKRKPRRYLLPSGCRYNLLLMPKQTLIVGASFSGLACAAALQRLGLPYLLIEKESMAGMPWRRHYDRLHLHTSKAASHLPYYKFARNVPKYPSRQAVVDYLEAYCRHHNITPGFNITATRIRKQEDQWITETNAGTFSSDCVVMATGAFARPKTVRIPGMHNFPGEIIHSGAYTTGSMYKNKKVLVIGFGNSACEIAIDLFEHGAAPALSVRSAVNVVPRDIAGIPILQLSRVLSVLPVQLADGIAAPLVRLMIGNIKKLGLKKMPYGPLQQIKRDLKAPVLDIGTIKHIRAGHIAVYGGIERITGNEVAFYNGEKASFDAIVAAIGYEPGYTGLLEVDQERFDDMRLPVRRQRYFGNDGLYFCGFWISPTGQIREIGKDALAIAKHIRG